MTSHRTSLSEAANNLFEAIHREAEDYILEVDRHGFLDLVDPMTGEREPIATAFKKAEK